MRVPRPLLIALCLPFLPFLAACSSVQMPEVTSMITPYKIDIRQGNYVDQEMIAQLKPGMTRDQVRFILGTPLVADIFHADRWDYVYSFKPGRGDVQLRRFAVYFADDKLVRLSGDVEAMTAEGAATDAAAAAAARNRVIEIGSDADEKKKAEAEAAKKSEGESSPEPEGEPKPQAEPKPQGEPKPQAETGSDARSGAASPPGEKQ